MTARGLLVPTVPWRYFLAAVAVTAWLAGSLLFQPVAAAAAAESGSQSEDAELEEVEVRAKRARISELRQEAVRLESQIYARYNELNRIDRFDIVCSDDAATGTRIERRFCRPKFQDQAKAEEGQVAFLAIQQIHDPTAPVGAASVQLPDSPVPRIMQQVPHFQRHMRQIMEKDEQLQDLLRERAAAAEELRRAQRELFSR